MKCLVLHESDTRIRIRIPKLSMSLHQADLLEYYLKDIPGVKKVSVDERTGNAVIVFSDNKAEKRQMLNQALRDYDETSEKVAALVPEETGRALNREYEERLLCKILTHNLAKWFLPMPVRRIWTVAKSIPFLWKAVKTTATGGLKVELLDGIAIGTSILRGDYATAASVIFLLDTGEILEESNQKKIHWRYGQSNVTSGRSGVGEKRRAGDTTPYCKYQGRRPYHCKKLGYHSLRWKGSSGGNDGEPVCYDRRIGTGS